MSDENKIGLPTSMSIPGSGERLHMKDTPVGSKCDIHDWPTAGLATRLLQAMRARHKTGGVNACTPCIERAKTDAKKKPDAT